MYNANYQNTQLRLREELTQCGYNPSMKDYITNMLMQVLNFPKKTTQARHFIKTLNQDRLIMVWYPMSIPFGKKSYNVPLLIYFMKNIPKEPPQIFLEVVQGSAANPTNKDVNPNSKQVTTNTLKNWSQYSNIENAMNEIYASFTNVFPIYKTSGNSNPPPSQNSTGYGNNNASGGGGIYNVLNNAVQNAYQQQKYGQRSVYQPPTHSIYGRSMTLEGNQNKEQSSNTFGGGIYGQNNNNNNNNNTFGGGIYGQNNNNNNNTFGGGIYGQNKNNNNNTFGGGIYGQNNNNNNNTFGGGIYGQNKNNNYIPPANFYGNNNQTGNNQYQNQWGKNNYNNQYGNNNNQYGNYNNQYGNYNQTQPNYMGVNSNPDEEFKNILVNEVSEKISNKLIEENKRLNVQNQKLKEYKAKFGEENEKVQNFVNRQFEIKSKCEEDMSNIKKVIKDVQDYNDNNKELTVNNENCLTFIDVPDPDALKIIANEASMEELVLIVRKGFERKKISFQDAISFMRNSSRDLFTIKFLKDKVIRKYRGNF